MTGYNKDMTEDEIQAILTAILGIWKELSPTEVKSLLKILMVHGELPKCAACGQPILSMDDFSWDHAFPESKGGPTVIGNLQSMHTQCNVAKGNEIDEQYFCHIDPDLLQQLIKNQKKHNSRSGSKSKSKYETTQRRKHTRVNGWADMSSYYGRGRRNSK